MEIGGIEWRWTCWTGVDDVGWDRRTSSLPSPWMLGRGMVAKFRKARGLISRLKIFLALATYNPGGSRRGRQLSWSRMEHGGILAFRVMFLFFYVQQRSAGFSSRHRRAMARTQKSWTGMDRGWTNTDRHGRTRISNRPQPAGPPDDSFLRSGLVRSRAGQLIAQQGCALSRTGLDSERFGALTY